MGDSWDIGYGLPTDDKGPMVIGAAWLSFVVAALVLMLRVWLRTCLTKLFGWDDAFMIVALAFGLVHSSLINASVDNGLGTHQAELVKSQITQLTKYFWISGPIHDLAVNWGKVSAMLLLVRIIDKAKTQALYFYAGIVLLTLVNTVDVFIILGQCKPMEAAWNPMAYYISRVGKNTDYSWKMADLAIWGALKHHLVIITASIPTLGPLAQHANRLASSKGLRWFSYPEESYTYGSSYLPKTTSFATATASSAPSKKFFSSSHSASTLTGDSYQMSGYSGRSGRSGRTRRSGRNKRTRRTENSELSGHSGRSRRKKQKNEVCSSQEAIIPEPEPRGEEITAVTEVCIRTESKENNLEEYWEQRIKPWEARSPV
ncbi:hypothetical protein FQN49_006170 [Arthroderma sp. PD_2]|nr:hypothetical protein FQN49_006170 [Arthroderma sp. PD_2]